jgi:hypothetical protein
MGANSVPGTGSTALVTHATADDMKSDPAGSAGDRIACGTIRRNIQCAASVVLQPRNLWRCVKKRHLLRAIVQTAKHFSADGGLRQSLFALAGALSWMANLIVARRTMRRFEFAADAFAARDGLPGSHGERAAPARP